MIRETVTGVLCHPLFLFCKGGKLLFEKRGA